MGNRKFPTIACEECKSRKNSFFGNLCSHELSEISDAKSCTNYKKGRILFQEGTRPLGTFFINQGKVKIYKLGLDGKEQIIKIAKEGDVLGYKAMLSEEEYSVTAKTLEDCYICFLPKHDFLKLVTESKEFNKRLLQSVCHEVGVMSENLINLAQKSVRERLAGTLLMLNNTYGVGRKEGEQVEINLTRADLANIVGTATETLIRLLHDFKEEGLISSKGRKIIVENLKGLTKIGGLH